MDEVIQSLKQRVDRLERANRRMKLMGLIALAALAATAHAPKAQSSAPHVVNAQQFNLTDANGAVLATLSLNSAGLASLTMFDESGNPLASLGSPSFSVTSLDLFARGSKDAIVSLGISDYGTVASTGLRVSDLYGN